MAARRTGLDLPLPLQFLAAWLAVWLGRVLQEQVDFLKAENRLLRERLGTRRMRLTDAERRRLATLGKRLGRRALAEVATVASPETILRWYRELVARKYDGSQQRGPGQPKRRGEIAELVLRVARENETWGYTRIRGALKNLGHEVGRNTIKRILQEHGIDPAPDRGKRMPWSTFIKTHLGVLVGMDFFTVEAVTWLGLVRYHVLFAVDIASRKVEILGIAVNPGGGALVPDEGLSRTRGGLLHLGLVRARSVEPASTLVARFSRRRSCGIGFGSLGRQARSNSLHEI